MKKTDEQLANELDAFLTAQRKGKPPTAAETPDTPEAKLVAELMPAIAQTDPDPVFASQLETHLKKLAHAKQQKNINSTKRPSIRQQFDQWIKEQMIMKRTIVALGGLAAILLAGFFAWNALRPAPQDEPVAGSGDTGTVIEEADTTDAALADAGENNDETEPASPSAPVEEPATSAPAAGATELAALPPLPNIQGGGDGRSFGGGGPVTAESSLAAEAPIAADDIAVAPFFTDIFSGTQFVLNTALPTDVTTASVQQQASLTMEMAEARTIADAFGFTGPLYMMPEQTFLDEEGMKQVEQIPVSYFAFDGTRAITIDVFGTYYRDDAVSFEFETQIPLEQIVPAAEAFLQERGLLDFPYTSERLWGNEVLFYRLIDGRPVNQAEIVVTFNDQGEIAFVSHQKLRNLVALGNYPLRTAEEAFQLLQDGVVQNNIWYIYEPGNIDESLPVEPFEPSIAPYRYWQRSYQAGEEIHLYTWPTVYLPADGVGLPRIEAYPFSVQGSEEMMQAIAADPNHQFHFWGVVGTNGRSLELAGWETFDSNQEPIFAQGTVRQEGDQMLFETESGEIYIIPGAPEDLPQNERLNLFGWALRDVGAAYPVVDWENLDVFIEYPETGEVIEGPIVIDEGLPPFEPVIYQQVAIDQVGLIYVYSYIYPELAEAEVGLRYAEPPTTVLQPAWKFSGQADNGDRLSFIIEAVAPEYIQSK